MFRLGIFDRPIVQTPIDAPAAGGIAQSIGEQSAVLLKNANDLLPLNAGALGFWISSRQKWATIDGDVEVDVGTSAAEILLSKSIHVRHEDRDDDRGHEHGDSAVDN